jgi:glutamate/tyrosine decarboxylase-like PLP-dependent enzyme
VSGPEQSLLDPDDWDAYRAAAHAALDVALDFSRERGNAPVWRPVPGDLTALDDPIPLDGQPLETVVAEVAHRILPYTLGNTHPRFWGWVHGSGTPGGIVAQMLQGAINANNGGREHAPVYIERQLLRWMCELFGYPAGASGLMCTGTSAATLYGLAVARYRCLGEDVRHGGNGGARLTAYCSQQAHVSVAKAMELLGLGRDALRAIPVNPDFTLDVPALAAQLDRDRADGCRPFAVVSSVGSVNTGAIDDLEAIAAVSREYGVWHHVDGAFGALLVTSEALRSRLRGIETADSIAFDFHKWMHVTYAAACLLVRDGDEHLATFHNGQAYLQPEDEGVAAGAPWPSDYGIDLSRGFEALGVWMQLKEHGLRGIGAAIERNCEQAAWLGQRVEEAPKLELLAPVSMNIVCFRYAPPAAPPALLDDLNRRLTVALQVRAVAVPSLTMLNGRAAIRVCITNHRTRREDLQALLAAVIAIGDELLAGEEGAS